MASAQPNQENDAPRDIKFDSVVVDLCFHPERDVIASGDIDGDITVHSYSTSEKNHVLLSLTHHKKACRGVRFNNPNGNKLYSISKDKSLQVVDIEKGAVCQSIKKAHSEALYSLLVSDENIVATGDDGGVLKVWDLRQQKAIMEMKENEEYLSDLVLDSNRRILLATSGDGTLTAFDIRKHKMKLQSELFDSELLSLAVVKNEEKVVCGTGEGVLNIFNWGQWGNISDRFPGHPMSIDCMTTYNSDVIFTGSFDGIIRAVNILPNRFLGVVGQHEKFPVENLSLSRGRDLLASCSHDQRIKFWNVENIDSEEVDTTKRAKKTNKPKMLNKNIAKNDFFADLAEGEAGASGAGGESDSDSDENDTNSSSDGEDSDDEGVQANGKTTSKQQEDELDDDESDDDSDSDT